MVAQSFKERVIQVATEQAKVYDQVFLRYEYLLCAEAFSDKPYYIISAHADKSKPMTLLRGDRLDAKKCASADLVLRRPYGTECFTEIVFGDYDDAKKYMNAIKPMLHDALIVEKTKEMAPV